MVTLKFYLSNFAIYVITNPSLTFQRVTQITFILNTLISYLHDSLLYYIRITSRLHFYRLNENEFFSIEF